MTITLLTNDVNSVELKPESFDALLCDPPYGLEFMGKSWDKVVPPAATWKHLAKALKPGAPLLIFGGTRTFHRLAVALEDAGLEVRDTLCWLYGSGFPKSMNVGKSQSEWKGYGTALKPAWEPIIIARKPLDGTIAHNVKEHGCGALNIDGARVPHASPADLKKHQDQVNKIKEKGGTMGNSWKNSSDLSGANDVNDLGRFPSNLLLDEEAAQDLDQTTGTLVSRPFKENVATGEVLPLKKRTAGGYSDSGGASRYFYVAKASKKERGEDNNHPTLKPVKLTTYLAKLILPPIASASLLVPFSGSGSEIIGAREAGWEHITGVELSPEYVAIARKRLGLR